MSRICTTLVLSASLLPQSLLCAAERTPNKEPIPTVVFGFDLRDISLEGEIKGADPADTKRIEELSNFLPKLIEESGGYKLVGDPADIATFQKEHNLQSCDGCAGDFAKKAGAELAIWGTAWKVNHLSLKIDLTEMDADTGKKESMSTAIANTDYSSRRELERFVKKRFLTMVRP